MGMQGKTRRYTAKQIEVVKSLYATTLSEEIAKQLGCTISTVYNIANKLGLKKDVSFIAETARKRTLNPNHGGRKYLFKPGQTPANKGKKMTEYVSLEKIEKIKKTCFKKGHKPHNTLYDGCIRSRNGYLYIRISEGKWELLQRHIWVENYGEIPSDHNIVFKDGNRKNCSIENLKCISNAELAECNRDTKYPEELRKAIRLNNKLNKIIKQQYEQH